MECSSCEKRRARAWETDHVVGDFSLAIALALSRCFFGGSRCGGGWCGVS